MCIDTTGLARWGPLLYGSPSRSSVRSNINHRHRRGIREGRARSYANTTCVYIYIYIHTRVYNLNNAIFGVHIRATEKRGLSGQSFVEPATLLSLRLERESVVRSIVQRTAVFSRVK